MASQTQAPHNVPTWNLNPDKDGIEIQFDYKPTPEIRDMLKTQGFRWSPRFRIWYAKDTDANREFAATLAQDAPITLPRHRKPASRKRTKSKHLIVYKGKRKPKAITEKAAKQWLNNPAGVRVLYRVPGEWSAEEARRQIKHGHPRVKILLGERQTRAAQHRLNRLHRVIQDLDEVFNKFKNPPGGHRIVIVDEQSTEYKYDPHTQTVDKITGPALTQGIDIPLKTLLARSELFIRVHAFDDLITTRRQGTYMRGIGRVLVERHLGK